jgi:hypothetical protein
VHEHPYLGRSGGWVHPHCIDEIQQGVEQAMVLSEERRCHPPAGLLRPFDRGSATGVGIRPRQEGEEEATRPH